MTERGDPEDGSLSRLRERAGVRARSLRQSQTKAEVTLWNLLRGRQLLDLGLIVELDGGQHAHGTALTYDERRTKYLESEGFQVLRFWNHEVLNETQAVMEKIRQVAEALTPALSRKREREQQPNNSFAPAND